MNKKKLPRAVTQTADDMRKAGAIESSRPGAEAGPATGVVEALTLRSTDVDAARRRSQANAIVERYANLSAVGGVIPLPLVNVAGVTVIILRMVKRLCDVYGVPYQSGRARALVVGLAGGAVPTTASAVTTTTLIYFVPGANLVGLAVSSVTASICTRGIGRRFVEHFETGATLLDFPVIERQRPAAS
jgi:uncharacterized protein (DUF697 family)